MKIRITIVFLFFWSAAISQVSESEVVQINCLLNSSLVLTIDNNQINFTFNTVDQFQNGIISSVNSQTNGSVSATCNWNLSIMASADALLHSDGLNTVPLDVVGYQVELTGSPGINRIQNNVQNTIAALSNMPNVVLTRSVNTNAGSDNANAFRVNWEMGTSNGSMNALSILEGDYKKGEYSTNIDFIVSEIL